MYYEFLDVEHAFTYLSREIDTRKDLTAKSDSRNGPVTRFVKPVLVQYLLPRQRVLLNTRRDANPFFHLFEALWMLAGSDDVEPLKHFSSKIDRFSDDGETLNGAYGYRWRHAVHSGDNIDQIDLLVKHLRKNPDSRRAVLQMWNVDWDLMKIESSKDVCCNTCIYFEIVNKRLNMMVSNRSNDMLWGLLGANYVHFTFLQEYIAASLDLHVGQYNHVTNNLHVYHDTWKGHAYYDQGNIAGTGDTLTPWLFDKSEDKELFDEEVKKFIQTPILDFKNEFLETVAKPMVMGFTLRKSHRAASSKFLESIASSDWKQAAINWIERRKSEAKV